MKDRLNSTDSFIYGLISGLPVVIGYLPVAVAFGLLSKTVHVSFKDTFLFSSMVYAGASQFMALDLIKAGMATGSILLATFLLNLRHLMMSASLSVKLKGIKRAWLPFVAFGVTDETFSIASLSDRPLNTVYLITMQAVSYGSWVCSTVIGYLVGSILPDSVQSSLGIGLYAMFAAILVPEIKKSSNILFLALTSGILYVFISYFKLLPSSWILIITIIVSSALGAAIIKDEVKEAPQA